MNGDITRSTFHPKKHYNAVRMQQGRVQLDADWNEQVDIQNYFTQSLAKYVIGDSGVIRNSDSFKIFAAGQDADFTIAAGQMYVNGIICELEQNTTYKTQLDYPNPPQLSEDGFYLAYLDVWERDITALEDPEIREPALKGLDTATRTKILWQVKLIPVPNINPQKPEITNWKFFADALNPNRKVYLKAATASSISEGNLVNPQKGYLGSENQLYRVEIHQSGDINQATFKWSRNNRIIVSNIESIKGNTIDISSIGRDDLLSFQPNQWVEIIDQEQVLKNEPGVLLQLQKVFNKKLDVVGDPIETKFADKKNLQVIGWQEDQDTKKAEIAVSPNWIQLEKGIYIQFDPESTYKTGDYWLIPARAYTKDVDWPYDKQRSAQRSQGIKHYYSPLALLKYSNSSNNGTFTPLQDYRPTFPTLVNCLDKTGDTMTGDLEIQANLYVTNGGKVGIGTGRKEPQEKLHVDGNVRISNGTKLVNIAPQIDKWMQFTTNLDGYYFDQSIRLKNGVISSDEAANLALQTNGKTQLEIFNESGNVGIGVDPADAKLHVNGVVRIGTTESFLDIATGTDNLSHFKTNLNGYSFDKGIQIQNGALRIGTTESFLDIATGTDNLSHFQTNLNGYQFDKDIKIQSGVISSDANNLSLQTNGKTQLTIFNATENIGIGVASADEKLHVNGVVRIGTTENFLDIATGTDNLSHFKTNLNGFYFDKGIQIQNGVVRIGTTENFLDIATGTDNLSHFKTNLNGFYFDKGIQIQNGVVRIGTTENFLDITTGTDNLSHFKTNLNGFYFDKGIQIQNGALRIGTTENFLDIATGTDNLSRFQTNLDGYSFDKGIQIQNGVVRIGTTESFLDIATGTDNLSRFKTNLNGFYFDKGIQIQNGVVRIGTTDSFLDIATGTDNLSHFKTNLDGYSFDKGIQIQSGVISSDANNLLLQTNGITQMILTTGGNVTIGNTLPASDAKLYVVGNLRINGRIFQDSSRELKENITDLSSQEVTEILRTIKPIKFNYKNSVDKDIHAGFLSENVPSLLTSPDNTAISPVDIVAVLTKAVKDQDIKISLLLNALRDQRTQIATLMDKVRVLESKE